MDNMTMLKNATQMKLHDFADFFFALPKEVRRKIDKKSRHYFYTAPYAINDFNKHVVDFSTMDFRENVVKKTILNVTFVVDELRFKNRSYFLVSLVSGGNKGNTILFEKQNEKDKKRLLKTISKLIN